MNSIFEQVVDQSRKTAVGVQPVPLSDVLSSLPNLSKSREVNTELELKAANDKADALQVKVDRLAEENAKLTMQLLNIQRKYPKLF
jgi:cell shape-determining protein MreC